MEFPRAPSHSGWSLFSLRYSAGSCKCLVDCTVSMISQFSENLRRKSMMTILRE